MGDLAQTRHQPADRDRIVTRPSGAASGGPAFVEGQIDQSGDRGRGADYTAVAGPLELGGSPSEQLPAAGLGWGASA